MEHVHGSGCINTYPDCDYPDATLDEERAALERRRDALRAEQDRERRSAAIFALALFAIVYAWFILMAFGEQMGWWV